MYKQPEWLSIMGIHETIIFKVMNHLFMQNINLLCFSNVFLGITLARQYPCHLFIAPQISSTSVLIRSSVLLSFTQGKTSHPPGYPHLELAFPSLNQTLLTSWPISQCSAYAVFAGCSALPLFYLCFVLFVVVHKQR